MISEEIACLISNRARQSPPDAVTGNMVLAVVQQSVMLYHTARFRQSPVALVRAVCSRVDGALDARDVAHGSVLAIHDCPCRNGESIDRSNDVPKNRRFNRKVEAACHKTCPELRSHVTELVPGTLQPDYQMH